MPRSVVPTVILIVTAGLAFAFAANGDHRPLYANAPEKFRQLRNPLEGDTQAVEIGRRLFERSCANCHMPDSQGHSKGPQLAAVGIRNAPPGALFWLIKSGNTAKGMPGFSQLPDKQKWQIVTYLMSLEVTTDADATPAPH